MNKIFKVVWSKARNCYVVVSEYGRKNARAGRLTKGALAVFGSLLVAGAVNAGKAGAEEPAWVHYDETTGSISLQGNSATGAAAISWGGNNEAAGERSTSFGLDNVVSGANSTGFGRKNVVGMDVEMMDDVYPYREFKNMLYYFDPDYTGYTYRNATAWGEGNAASNDNATAWGTGNYAGGRASTSWGNHNYAIGDYATAFGEYDEALGRSSTAWGDESIAYGDYSTAFGDVSRAYGYNSLAALGGQTGYETGETDANGNPYYEGGHNAFAVGRRAVAKLDDSVALGSGAVADTPYGKQGAFIDYKAAGDPDYVWKSTENAISVGDTENGVTRQITGVAAGTELTDAVNVAQLKAAVNGGSGVHYYSVNSTNKAEGSNYNNDGATGTDAIAIGYNVQAGGESSIAIGHDNEAYAYESSAIGANNTVGYSDDSESGKYASAIGGYNEAYGYESSAIGQENEAYGYESSAIGAYNTTGSSSDSESGKYASAIGYENEAYGYESSAIGAYNTTGSSSNSESGEYASAIGHENEAYAYESSAIGSNNTVGYSDDPESAQYASAIGGYNEAYGEESSAIGQENEAYGYESSAIGYYNKSYGTFSVAMGSESIAHTDYSVALGIFAEAGVADSKEATLALAIGVGEELYDESGKWIEDVGGAYATAKKSIAIGYDTHANAEDTVAIGSNAVADRAAGMGADGAVHSGYDPRTKAESTKTNSTWRSTKGVFSVGDAANDVTRQITGVAAGIEDTDAVNVAQLKAVQGSAGGGAGGGAHYFSVMTDSDDDVSGKNNNFDNDGAKAIHAVAIGYNSKAEGENSVALMGNTVGGDNSIAWGEYTNAQGRNSTAFGYRSVAGVEVSHSAEEDTYRPLSANRAWTKVPDQSSKVALFQPVAGGKTYSNATAFGFSNAAGADNAVAFGEYNYVGAENSVAFGHWNDVVGENSMVLGDVNYVSGENSIAFGHDVEVTGDGALAGGYRSRAEGLYSVAFGDRSIATGECAMAWNSESQATGENATAFGEYTIASGRAATSWGIEDTTAGGDYSTAWGDTRAYGRFSTSFGNGSRAYGDNSLAALGGQTGYVTYNRVGYVTETEYHDGENAVAIGQAANGTSRTMSYAYGKNSVALIGATTGGYELQGYTRNYVGGGENTFAVGLDSNAIGEHSIAMLGATTGTNDEESEQTGYKAFAVGGSAEAIGDYSTAMGYSAKTTGEDAVAIGEEASANAEDAMALGHEATANGEYSTAIGYEAVANAEYSTAIGYESVANGEYSIAMIGAKTGKDGESGSDYGYDAFAAGYGAEAIGNYSIAIGENAKAVLEDSVALGSGSLAQTEAGSEGFLYEEVGKDSGAPEYVWKATKAAVAIGDPSAETPITRQIIGVAAGTEDTDAVNVAQLKAVQTVAGQHNTVTSKDNSVTIVTSTNEEGGINYDLAVVGGSSNGNISYKANAGEASSVSLEQGLDFTNGKNTTASVAADGVVKYDLNDNISLTSVTTGDTVMNTNGLTVGDTVVNKEGLTIKNGPSVTVNGVDAGGKKIINVAAGVDPTDAVNVSQLQSSVAGAKTEVKAGTNVSSVEYSAAEDGHAIYTVNVDNMRVTDGSVSYDESGQGTLQLIVGGDKEKPVKIEGLQNTTYKLTKQGRNIELVDSSNTVAGSVIDEDHVTNLSKVEGKVQSGNSKLVDVAVSTVEDGKTVTKTGTIDMSGLTTKQGDANAKGIAALQEKDAQLQDAVAGNTQQITKVDNRVNRVGARAAALAALHPLDFDPDDKLTFAAGYGHYHGENAGAVGAFYRPDEKTMFSLSGTLTNHENMLNAGISFSLDRVPHVTNSKTAMAKQIIDLNAKVEILTRQNAEIMDALREARQNNGRVDIDFQDLPEGYWTYAYVQELTAAGYLNGYSGSLPQANKPMTRYEFAGILYHAMQNHAPIDAKMGKGVEEFAKELDTISKVTRFRVDRISGENDARHKVERVRVNDRPKEERDVYGNKLQK